MNTPQSPPYLQPYLDAAKRYGAGFGTLLWASPKTQAARFGALLDAAGDVTGQAVLDVGCGRADFLEFLLHRRIVPMRYVGLEAVNELVVAAENKKLPNARIVRGDFIADPDLMRVGADVIFFSGSLNTLDESAFYRSIAKAFAAAHLAVVFNFLSSPALAATAYLTWHQAETVMSFARTLSPNIERWDRYLKGDTTIAIRKDPEPA
jgi:trans-aconitate methyltransferase